MAEPGSIFEANEAGIQRAVDVLRKGRLVAFPTETVYGLGCDARDDQAVAAVYEAKGRPEFNPLIIHVHEPAALDEIVEWTEKARLLALQFWPGPVTLILKRKLSSNVSLLATAGLETIAVRIPSHPVALTLLRAFGGPVAAPSANASGKLSPTTPLHVAESLGRKVDLILAGGRASIGIESTVLDLVSEVPVILRPGAITLEQLQMNLGQVRLADPALVKGPVHSPGMLASHYAPDLPLRINVLTAERDENFLTFGPDLALKGGARRLNLSEKGDLIEAAANLFSMLRELDEPSLKGIAVAPIPERGLGSAINDRLTRASADRSKP